MHILWIIVIFHLKWVTGSSNIKSSLLGTNIQEAIGPVMMKENERDNIELNLNNKSNTSVSSKASQSGRRVIKPKPLDDRHSWSRDKKHPIFLASDRFTRALQTKEEREIFEKKRAHEIISEQQRQVNRRKAVQHHITCNKPRSQRHHIVHFHVEDNECYVPGVHVSLRFGHALSYCVNCLDAHETGSIIETWTAGHGPKSYHIDGLLTYAVPNTAIQ